MKWNHLLYLLSHPIQICQKFLLILPPKYIPNPTTSDHPTTVTVLVGVTHISHLDNPLLTGLPAVILSLPEVPSQHSRQAYPLILLKCDTFF